MFSRLFSKNAEKSETGIYVIDGKEIHPLNELPGNGSINSIGESLGCTRERNHTVHTFNSKLIEFIVFDKQTLKPIFLGVVDKTKAISYADVSKEIKRIDWDFERRTTM